MPIFWVARYNVLAGKGNDWGGIEHEFICIQHTSQGDFVVVSDDGKDVSKWAEKLAASKHPFDQWFMKKIEELHGPTGPAPPANELYLDTCQ